MKTMNRSGKAITIVVFVTILLTACSGESVPLDPTAQALYLQRQAEQATQRAEYARMTAQALEAEQVKAEAAARQAEATAEYYRLLRTATMEAVIAEATAISQRETQTAWNATVQAQQTATERAWIVQQTQSALQAQQTAQSWQMTQTAAQSEATATQVALLRQATVDAANAAALATAQAAQAGIAQEALRQEQIRTVQQDYAKYAWAALPFVLLALVVVMSLYGLWLYQRNRVLTQLADGKLVLVQDGKVVVPDRSPGAVLDPRNPPRLDAGQLRVTENDQKVSAIRALVAGGQKGKAERLAQTMAEASSPIPDIRVVAEQDVRPLLGEVVNGIYQEAVEEK
ncbi:hypothetical protein ANT_21810 [Anaerolinea thermophila UNI-1]|uniref:Uncharacterized protein n=1 Tax=Anaerolinea thermophila (strain DSM 14523 / JCM 11388 / NBRC 100420 / UNI-1) TaxID=926569 RepID=E8MXX6_ANATU|nr:hypothetical protein ANT_21810 [Anaerolinea thermophila UNI-1]